MLLHPNSHEGSAEWINPYQALPIEKHAWDERYIYHKNQLNVGKYTIHGWYRLYAVASTSLQLLYVPYIFFYESWFGFFKGLLMITQKKAPLKKNRYTLPGSLTVRPWKCTIPKGKACLPTIFFQGRAVKLREGITFYVSSRRRLATSPGRISRGHRRWMTELWVATKPPWPRCDLESQWVERVPGKIGGFLSWG